METIKKFEAIRRFLGHAATLTDEQVEGFEFTLEGFTDYVQKLREVAEQEATPGDPTPVLPRVDIANNVVTHTTCSGGTSLEVRSKFIEIHFRNFDDINKPVKMNSRRRVRRAGIILLAGKYGSVVEPSDVFGNLENIKEGIGLSPTDQLGDELNSAIVTIFELNARLPGESVSEKEKAILVTAITRFLERFEQKKLDDLIRQAENKRWQIKLRTEREIRDLKQRLGE